MSSPYRLPGRTTETPESPTPQNSSSSLVAILLIGFVLGIGLVVTRNADRCVARIIAMEK